MEYLPLVNKLLFILTTSVAIWIFFIATKRSFIGLLMVLAWLLFQAIISIKGFYVNGSLMSPRVMLLILPPMVLIVILLVSPRGRQYTDLLNPATLTLVHTIRIAVEIVLYGLFLEKQVPRLMTFAGGNYDILSGLSAPIIYYLAFVKKSIGKKIMLAWNLVCMTLLFSIVIHALLSVATPFQQFAFDQPNKAILEFPYCWLPSFIVPLVLCSHLVSIRYWWLKKETSQAHVSDSTLSPAKESNYSS